MVSQEAIDNGNYKKAVQMAEKLLSSKQKQPQLMQMAHVAKGVALFRSGKLSDALEEVSQVTTEVIVDEMVIQGLIVFYKDAKPDEIPKILEKAVAVSKGSERLEFMNKLFLAYARTEDYKKQQQAAMNLYRSDGKRSTYWWAVFSNVLQAYYSTDKNLSKKMFLPLAEKMMQKMIGDGGLHTEAEILLYVMILRMSDKISEALKVVHCQVPEIEGDLLIHRDFLKIEMLQEANSHAELNSCLKAYLRKRCDDWRNFNLYLDSVFNLIDMEWKPKDNNEAEIMPDYTIDMATEFICSLLENGGSSGANCSRGPYLAQMEIKKRHKMRTQGKEVQSCVPETFNTLLKEYFARFGNKGCCFQEMTLHFDQAESQEELISSLEETLRANESSYIDLIIDGKNSDLKPSHVCNRFICVATLKNYAGCYRNLSFNEKLKTAQQLIGYHGKGLSLGKELKSSELQYTDDFCVLACHLLLDLSKDTDDGNDIWHIILVLESALKASPHNPQMRIILIILYCKIGAFEPAHKIFNNLSIKYIQHDTLGYLMTSNAHRLGHFKTARSIYEAEEKFFLVSRRECVDQKLQAYKYGNFTKITEFIDFEKRLQNSLQLWTMKYYKFYLDVIHKSSSCDEALSFLKYPPNGDILLSENFLNQLIDGRDVRIIRLWDKLEPNRLQSEADWSMQLEILHLKYLSVNLQLLGDVIELSQKVSNDSDAQSVVSHLRTSLTNFIDESKTLYQRVVDHPGFKCLWRWHGPPQTRWNSIIDGGLDRLLLDIASVLLKLICPSKEDLNFFLYKETNENVGVEISKIGQTFADGLQRYNLCNENAKCFNGHNLEPNVLLVETLGYIVMLMGAFVKTVKSISFSRKSRKKKSASQGLAIDLENFKLLITSVQSACDDVVQNLVTIKDNFLVQNLGHLKISFNLQTKEQALEENSDLSDLWLKTYKSNESDMLKNVRDSYQVSIQELLSVAKLKHNIAKTLSL
ncbi:N-alpha-acetyltransferase 25, NatB auxiliary subunit [Trichoplax sp. H2]|nr:N-alpha-acetyltransferase 25, NatB auxiliary subunit [Trichoplax sp. H2]|eukprot:RDD41535.1 N-alpha-acetyltransferase 25, NatB auxiliary subunit [Trichoplax sp. H2]